MASEVVSPERVRQDRPDPAAARSRVEGRRGSQVIPVVALVLGCLLTAASYRTSSSAHLAFRLPQMHAVIDTTIGLVSLLLAYLVYGRALVLGRQRDYVLAFALGLGGLVNIFAAFTRGVSSTPLGRFEVWTATLGRLLVALLFAAAATIPEARHKASGSVTAFVLGIVVVFGSLVLFVAIVAPHLPWSADLVLSPTAAGKPKVVGPPLLLVVEGLVVVAYTIAGWSFSRRRNEDDALMMWLAASCLLFALASLDYLSFPSIFSDWIYVGDLLGLAGVLLLFIGAALEISRYWSERVAMDERRRVADDLHDGVAQELVYIATMARLLERDPSARDARRLADAAQHALDESRLVISTLAGAGNSREQIAMTARDAAHRFDIEPVIELPETVALRAEVVEALLRIVREAVTNVGRHAHATAITVRLETSPGVELEIRDDGVGFDATQPGAGFGLTGMRERASAIGGALTVTTAPGLGTTIRVVFP